MNHKLNLLAFALSGMLVGGAMDILAEGLEDETAEPAGETVPAGETGNDQYQEEQPQQEPQEEKEEGFADEPVEDPVEDGVPAAQTEGEEQKTKTYTVSNWQEFKDAADEINADTDLNAQYVIEMENDISDMPTNGNSEIVFRHGTTTLYGNGHTYGCDHGGGDAYFQVENEAVLNLGSKDEAEKSRLTVTGHGSAGYAMLYARQGATLNIHDGVLITARENLSSFAGGVYAESGYGVTKVKPTTVNMYGGTISECTNKAMPFAAAVGIQHYAVFNMYGGEIKNNVNESGRGYGGAILSYGTVNIYGGKITDNKAKYGGAIFVIARLSSVKAELNIYGGCIENNTAQSMGGGVYITANEDTSYELVIEPTVNSDFEYGTEEDRRSAVSTFAAGLPTASSFNYQGGVIQNNSATQHSDDIFLGAKQSYNLECNFGAQAGKETGFGLLKKFGEDIDGWYVDKSGSRWKLGNRPADTNLTVLNNTEAGFKAARGPHVTFDLKGGVWETVPDSFVEEDGKYYSVMYKDETVADIPIPVETRAKFMGWYTAEGDPFDLHTPIDQDYALVAKWEYETIETVTVGLQYDAEYEGSSLKMSDFDPTATIVITPVDGRRPLRTMVSLKLNRQRAILPWILTSPHIPKLAITGIRSTRKQVLLLV